MESLINFLHDGYQEDLRNIAQTQSEKYEEALERYRDNFISELILIKESKMPEEDKDYKFLYNLITSINTEEVAMFFDSLIQIYIEWIDTNGQQALNKFEKLLKDFQLLSFNKNLENDILFRGRFSKSILTHWDMFHIPYNKRYLISNQRYSLTGQPLLYLGFSVLDVVSELDGDFNDFSEINFSTFKVMKPFKVFDLRNEFYKYFRYNPLHDLIDDSEYLQFTGYHKKANFEKLILEFYKFILSSVCSFQKRKEHKGFSFCEEYVLPQMLAQIIKKNNFEGIIYCSTRFKDKANDNEHKTVYKDNLALFTNYCREHVYDRKLYDKFNISNPTNYNQIRQVSLEQIEEICDKIKILDNEKGFKDYYLVGADIKEKFSNIKIDESEYFNHKIGKMHVYLVYNILIDIRNECMRKRRKVYGDNN